MANTLPSKDADLLVRIQTLRDAIVANKAALEVNDAEMTELDTLLTGYRTSLSAKEQAALDAENAVQMKNAGRLEVSTFIKALQAKFDANPALNDEQRATVGLDPRNAPKPTPQPIVMPRPLVIVDFSDRLEHTIRCVSEENPHDRKQPAGLWSTYIYMKVDGPMPASPDELPLLTSAPRPPLVVKHDAKLAGKTAYYAVRYVGRDAKPGPLSEVSAATIAA